MKDTNKHINELRTKRDKAASDKQEVVRDLSTYENNVTSKIEVKGRLGGLIEKLQSTRGKLRCSVKFDSEGEPIFINDDNNSDDISSRSKQSMKEHWTSIYQKLLKLDINRAMDLAKMMNLDVEFRDQLRH